MAIVVMRKSRGMQPLFTLILPFTNGKNSSTPSRTKDFIFIVYFSTSCSLNVGSDDAYCGMMLSRVRLSFLRGRTSAHQLHFIVTSMLRNSYMSFSILPSHSEDLHSQSS